MASIVIDTLWLSDAVDLTDVKSFPLMSQLKVVANQQGEVRTRANGRRVTVSRVGVAHTFIVTLPHCDRDQIDWIEAHIGRTVLIRDDRGRKVYGIYYSTSVEEIGYLREGNVELTMEQLTSPEGV